MIKKLRLRPFVLPSIYLILVVSILLGALYSYNTLTSANDEEVMSNDVDYVTDTDINGVEEETPVLSTDKVIIKPIKDDTVKIAKYFYDKDDKEEKRKESIVYYGNTYMQNSGIDYINDKEFDVVAVMDGTITSIKDDELLGKTIEIKHENKLVSIYQGLGEVSVKEGDAVTSGMVIAKSGDSTLKDVNGKHLHFELVHDGAVVNPEKYFDKNVNDL